MTRLEALLPPAEEWDRRTAEDRPIEEALFDPVWRLCNLYTIYDKKRQRFVPFTPKPEQRIIIWDLFVRGIKNLIIPKARQIGFSTLLALIALDIVMWQSGAKAALVDKTKEDGVKKMQDIVRVAWDRLPEYVQALFPDKVLNESSFGVRMSQVDTDGWSRFRVEKSGRGDALVFLWVSEWGTIQFEEPKRSLEIRTGGMAAAEGGIRVIETTWKGGEGGDVWPYVEMALSVPDEKKDPATDWYIRFFPWFVEPSYSMTATGAVRPHIAAYLDHKEAEIGEQLGKTFTFTPGQRAWYDRREQEFGLFVKREYPTTLDECWEAPVEGAVYADLYAQALAEGRVYKKAHVAGVPVHTLWDLGSPENTVVWYWQEVSGQIRFIDCDMKLWLTTDERVKHMRAKGYLLGKHYLPHDSTAMKTSVLTFRGELVAAGLEGTVVVPRTPDVHLGINRTRMLFGHFVFDPETCGDGIKSLKAYHYHPERHEPVHDWASHAADSLKVLAEAQAAGLLSVNIALHTMPHEHFRYFDPDGLAALRSMVLTHEGSTVWGAIDSGTLRRVPEDEAWLRLWEAPHVGGHYLISAVKSRHEREGDAVTVWKVEKEGHLREVAALADCVVDVTVLARWLAVLSGYYGNAVVVPVIDDTSGLLEALLAAGCGTVFARDLPRENRRIGQGKRLRKRGYELTPEARQHGLTLLQEAIREEILVVRSRELVDQAEQFIQPTPEEPPRPAPGHGESWLIGAAVALHAERSATKMAPVSRVEAPASLGSGRRELSFSGDADS